MHLRSSQKNTNKVCFHIHSLYRWAINLSLVLFHAISAGRGFGGTGPETTS